MDVLRAAWDRRKEPGASEELERLVRERPELLRACAHEYPRRHGIGFLRAGDVVYALSRCLSCGGRLFLVPVPHPPRRPENEEGIPLWLEGRALEFWTALEERSPWEDSRDYRRLQEVVESSSDAELRALLDLVEDDDE